MRIHTTNFQYNIHKTRALTGQGKCIFSTSGPVWDAPTRHGSCSVMTRRGLIDCWHSLLLCRPLNASFVWHSSQVTRKANANTRRCIYLFECLLELSRRPIMLPFSNLERMRMISWKSFHAEARQTTVFLYVVRIILFNSEKT